RGRGQTRTRARLYRQRDGPIPNSSQALARDLAEWGQLRDARSHREFLVRQHGALPRTARAFLHDGRQPRQLQRQQSVACKRRRRLCAVREHHRPRRNHLLLDRLRRARLAGVALAAAAALGALFQDRSMRAPAAVAWIENSSSFASPSGDEATVASADVSTCLLELGDLDDGLLRSRMRAGSRSAADVLGYKRVMIFKFR